MPDSDRDKLAAYLEDFRDDVAWASSGQEAAEHIAGVLGWIPPVQVIEDVADLDALLVGSVVLAHGVAYQAIPTDAGDYAPVRWLKPTSTVAINSVRLLAAARNADITVLWSPTEKAGR